MQDPVKPKDHVELKVADEAPAEALAVSAAGAASPAPTTELHGLLHSMKPARCHAKWQWMGDDDRVRQCRVCKMNAYMIDGLDGREMLELISKHEATPPAANQRLYRRSDGTVMLKEGKCNRLIFWSKLLSAILVVIALALAVSGLAPSSVHPVQYLLIAAGLSILFGVHISEKRSKIKTRRIKWIAALLIPLFCMTLSRGASLIADSISIISWLYFLIAASLDGIDAIVRKVCGDKAVAEEIAINELPPAPERIARERRKRLITSGAIVVVGIFIAYCIYDLSWLHDYIMVGAGDSVAAERRVAKHSGERAALRHLELAKFAGEDNDTRLAKTYFEKVITDVNGYRANDQFLFSCSRGVVQNTDEREKLGPSTTRTRQSRKRSEQSELNRRRRASVLGAVRANHLEDERAGDQERAERNASRYF